MTEMQAKFQVYTTEETKITFEDYFKNRFYMMRNLMIANGTLNDARWSLYQATYAEAAARCANPNEGRMLRIGKSEDGEIQNPDNGDVTLSASIHLYDVNDDKFEEDVTKSVILEGFLAEARKEFQELQWVSQASGDNNEFNFECLPAATFRYGRNLKAI